MEHALHAQTPAQGHTPESGDQYARRAESATLRTFILADIDQHGKTSPNRIRDLAGVTRQRALRELGEMVQDGTLELTRLPGGLVAYFRGAQ